MDELLFGRAEAWINDDPDPTMAEAGRAILNAGDESVVESHFGSRLEFGTAGLRGAIGPGPNRMNRALVTRVTYAVGQYLMDSLSEAPSRGVVVGYDGRHYSLEFAQDVVEVLGAMGFKIFAFPEVAPTPRIAHAVKYFRAAAGIMITASHNPPQDNGYKLYWENGAQIISPHDRNISAYIDKVPSTSEIDRTAVEELIQLRRIEYTDEVLEEVYLSEVSALRVSNESGPIKIVYSAMHGVGGAAVEKTLKSHGYHDFFPVAEQWAPDPDFSTVACPNPEEPGAMDLSLALAEQIGADLVLANDPDADRLCVAVPDGESYRLLSGNEVGILIADELLSHGEFVKPLVVTTIVSTSMLEKVARFHGAEYRDTLTGFKWIANEAISHESKGGQFVFGFEEAIGYSAGPVVRDKDGVSTALLMADLATRCRQEDMSILERLERICRRHGLHLTSQVAMKKPGSSGAAEIAAIMERLRADPPQSVLSSPVLRRRDLWTGEYFDVGASDEPPPPLPKSNVIGFWLESGARIMVRPSGTEPKIKFYFEVCESFGSEDSHEQVQHRAELQLESLQSSFMSLIG